MRIIIKLILLTLPFIVLSGCSNDGDSENTQVKSGNVENIIEKENQVNNGKKSNEENIEEDSSHSNEDAEDNILEGFMLFDEADSSIKFQHPDNWGVYTSYDDLYSAYYSLRIPEKPREIAPPYLEIFERKNDYENINTFAEEEFEKVLRNNIELIEDKTIFVDGQEGIFKKYSFKYEKPGLGWVIVNEIQVYVLNGDRSYKIVFGAFDELIEKYEDIGLEIINSLEFKDISFN